MASTTVTAPAAHETAVSPMPPSWAAFPRLTERSYMDPDTSLHECASCGTGSKVAALKACSRCKYARYCSRECQRANWPYHKARCEFRQQYSQLLHAADHERQNAPAGAPLSPLPDGVTLVELDSRLEKWWNCHQRLIMEAWFHCVDIPADLENVHKYIMYVRLEPREDHDNERGKYFRVADVYRMEVSEGMTRDAPWPTTLAGLMETARESERAGRGLMGGAVVEHPALPMRTFPFGGIFESAKNAKHLKNWKEIFMRDVELGKKVTRLVE